ncbi:MAG: hydroxymethylglutaryl-CoA synthase family protein [Chloroflexi bacterium]|nr:hydroxymethylglutaryl-CoA synthase family protein [Chloroflexota bacterium]
MVGIRSYGAYVPKYRLTKETKGWGFVGERAVANFDEDSVTMAVAAGTDCLRGIDRSTIDGLIFATTTAPYGEKQSAATIATALDLRSDIFTTDVTNVLRAGMSALRSAMDAVQGGSAKNVLVLAADLRMAAPKSATDRSLGDGAAALLISQTGVLATILGGHALSEHMIDVWRSSDDPFVHTGEDRFIADEGYLRVMSEVVATLLKQQRLTIKDLTKAAYGSGDSRQHTALSRKLGLAPEQVQDPFYGRMGNTGAAFPLMLLVAALEEAKADDRFLVAAYGDGAEAFLLQATKSIGSRPERRAMAAHLESKGTIEDYDALLQWRQLLAKEPARRPPPQPLSIQAAHRDRDTNLRLYAGKCTACGKVQYPAQRICTFCHAMDEVETWRLADRAGEIFTYSMDYVGGTPDVPLVIAVVNFEGGGRMLCMLTDREVDDVRVGLPVEMSFRKVGIFGEGIHNYYWKATPHRTPLAVNGSEPKGTAKAKPKGKAKAPAKAKR